MWHGLGTLTVGSLVGAALVTGTAVAVTTASAGTVTACAQRGSGHLRAVQSPEDCRAGETPLTWNQRGPAGPRGLPGVSGVVNLVAESVRDATDVKGVNVTCPPGKTVIGGGANITSDEHAVPVAITSSQFNSVPTANAWFAQAIEMRPVRTAWQVNAFVICANAR